MTSNIDEVIVRFKTALANAENIDFSAALEAGVNAALGEMKFRVFNTGTDSKGVSFGKYMGKRSRVTNRKYKTSIF